MALNLPAPTLADAQTTAALAFRMMPVQQTGSFASTPTLPWTRPLDDARSAVRDALSTAALDEHFVLTGTLDELTLDDITAQEDRLSVLTSIKGRLSVRYTP